MTKNTVIGAMKILCAWIGLTDLNGVENDSGGPIDRALGARRFDQLWLLTNAAEVPVEALLTWLRDRHPNLQIFCRRTELPNPNAFTEIYRHASIVVDEAVAAAKERAELVFHLSPGTPIMASVWLLLSTSRYDAELIESSMAAGVNTVAKPFNLPAEILPDLLRDPDRRLAAATSERPAAASTFGNIVYHGAAMHDVIALAKKAAPRNIPLLIEGESGTGKELLAHAVHMASPRHSREMIVVNCGAIPANLVESRLFGHKKGAFTGADETQKGCFEEADGSTLFLDEIGELPLAAQVALLRVIEAREVTRIGENKTRKVDVRIIAATNRDLFTETLQRRFREDLFYRLAVLRIRLPALRERDGDLETLIATSLARINKEMEEDPLYKAKQLDESARHALMRQSWNGNIRELQNTMRRALVWSDAQILSERDIEAALLPDASVERDDLLGRPFGTNFNLDIILEEITAHYIERALKKSGGVKTRAAKLLGYDNYQRLDAKMRKLGIS